MAHWQKNVKTGFYAAIIGWSGLFVLSVFVTVYDDHQDMVGATARIRRSMRTESVKTTRTLTQQVSDSQNALIAKQLECAREEGQSDALQRQNRDQQGTINGCFTQAMKLLTPAEQKTTILILDSETEDKPTRTVRWLLLTNKTVEHVRMVIECDRPLESSQLTVAGGATLSLGPTRMSANAWENTITSPAWTTDAPLVAKLVYGGQPGIGCSFTNR